MEFMVSALLCTLFILTITKAATSGKENHFQFSTLGLVSGLMNSAANYSILYLAATEKASVLFPIVSVANVIAAWGMGKLVFKEHLKPLQLCGLAAGVIAIFLLNL